MSSPRPSPYPKAPPADEARLHDYLEGERSLLELRCCAPKVLSVLIHDLSRPMSPSLEQAIARCLATGDIEGFWPAETLLPVMMRRFDLDPATLGRDPASRTLRTVCNACPRVGACWLALRQGAPLEECRVLCPNAEAFEARVASTEHGPSPPDESPP